MKHSAAFDPPDLLPFIAVEPTARGWRGLTGDGEVLEVESANGHPAEIPLGSRIVIRLKGEHIGWRAVPSALSVGVIDRYQQHIETAAAHMRAGKLDDALLAVDDASSVAATLSTRYSRGMILLELGRWQEGFSHYVSVMERIDSGFMRKEFRAAINHGLSLWHGENLAGRHLLLIHDHGFGDSIMMLRYVPVLKAMGAEITLMLPKELERLAQQCAQVVTVPVVADFFCPLMFLFYMLGQSPISVPLQPYLKADHDLVEKWAMWCRPPRHTIGVAWMPGRTHARDYPRIVPLDQLVEVLRLADPDVRLISVQQQGGEEAEALGVEHCEFEDFADCAALMQCCDTIVSTDTAAVHLAGAIGHPDIKLLLGHWASWRWLTPLYQNIKIHQQKSPDDWTSALAGLVS